MQSPAPYQPDDAHLTPEVLAYLQTSPGVQLRQAIAALPAHGVTPSVRQIAALRHEYPPDAVHAALTLAAIQPKACGPKGKFPQLEYVWATPEALEQATHIAVARHKAQRLVSLGAPQVFDLCAGLGGDTLAFAERMPVTAVELSPVRARCIELNAAELARVCGGTAPHPITVRVADMGAILDELPAPAWVHVDPARRSGGKRSPRFADLIPGPEILKQIFDAKERERNTFPISGATGLAPPEPANTLTTVPARPVPCVCRPAKSGSCSGPVPQRRGAIKLSPAVDFASLPPGHLELISHQGTVVQALLWLGTELPPEQRTASVLPREGSAFTLTGPPDAVTIAAAPITASLRKDSRILYEVDGAITRAGLAHLLSAAHHLQPLTMDGGYLLAAGPPPAQVPAHVLTPFEIWGIVPLARVRTALEGLPMRAPGAVEVKARGHLPGIDTDELQVKWSRLHRGACTVLLFRQGDAMLAAVGYRPNSAPPP